MRVRVVDGWADSPRALGALLLAVYALDIAYLLDHPNTPSLYASGVRYAPEPDEIREDWATIPVILARGWGDCDDLAPWRAAELTVREGLRAVPQLVRGTRPNQYHVVVRVSDGRWEDPSARLGMEVP